MTRVRSNKPQSSHPINFASEKSSTSYDFQRECEAISHRVSTIKISRLKKRVWKIAVGGGGVVTFFAPKKLPKRCKGSALDPWGDLVTMGVAPRSFDRWLVCTRSKWFSHSENQTLVHNFIVCGGGFHLSVIVRWYSTTHNAFNLPRSFLCYAQSMGERVWRRLLVAIASLWYCKPMATKNNPPVSLRLTPSFTQGGLFAPWCCYPHNKKRVWKNLPHRTIFHASAKR